MGDIFHTVLFLSVIFNIGFPGSISMLIMSVGLFFMNSILATAPNGDAHVAAYNLSNRIENFITLTLISISTSQVTIIGMFYGAKRFDLINLLINFSPMLRFSNENAYGDPRLKKELQL